MTTVILHNLSKPKHFITTADYSAEELFELVESAIKFKLESKYNYPKARTQRPLAGKAVGLLFSKRSTRTRIATETAANYLVGANSMFLGSHDSQLGVNETLIDSSRVISSMVCGIMARVSNHSEIETLARESSVPVINALSDKHHPTEIIADLVTLHEYFHHKKSNPSGDTYTAHTQHPRETLKGLKVAWIGDANNILREILVGFPKCGISVSAACPPGYVCDQDVIDIAQVDAKKSGATVSFTTKPEEAVKDCDVIITDTWVSMGHEEEKKKRLEDFAGFQVTNELGIRGGAKPDWIFMHCLPRKAEEVDDDVFYSKRSIVFSEAENRKWTLFAVLDTFLVKKSI
ncbi:ornithine carbamoyltransferase [Backusella circina FSU 941]|nr:ornithine carbamoyltransferase [Backusella circina FSU 941]